jgi:hypothetical protein
VFDLGIQPSQSILDTLLVLVKDGRPAFVIRVQCDREGFRPANDFDGGDVRSLRPTIVLHSNSLSSPTLDAAPR